MVLQIEKIMPEFKNFENHQIFIIYKLKKKNQKSEIGQFLESNYGFTNWKKIPKFKNFENHQNFIIDKLKKNNQKSEIVEFQKLENF